MENRCLKCANDGDDDITLVNYHHDGNNLCSELQYTLIKSRCSAGQASSPLQMAINHNYYVLS